MDDVDEECDPASREVHVDKLLNYSVGDASTVHICPEVICQDAHDYQSRDATSNIKAKASTKISYKHPASSLDISDESQNGETKRWKYFAVPKNSVK